MGNTTVSKPNTNLRAYVVRLYRGNRLRELTVLAASQNEALNEASVFMQEVRACQGKRHVLFADPLCSDGSAPLHGRSYVRFPKEVNGTQQPPVKRYAPDQMEVS